VRLTILLATAGAALLPAPAVASAHIQVDPKVVAPNDAVKFTVLVPGERSDRTVEVDLKMPADLLPFSYEDTPGWTRRLIEASNGGVDQIVWTGKLAKDGFAEFSFLAGTPAKPEGLAFKALQRYSGGTVVRWIGDPRSDTPAPVVQVVKGAPSQNAGGESSTDAGGGSSPATKPAATATATATATAAPVRQAQTSGGRSDTLAIVLGAAGLVLGAVALVVALTRRTPRSATTRATSARP
jgi:uncharacterized protein YcnI